MAARMQGAGKGRGRDKDAKDQDTEAQALKEARFDAEGRFRKLLERRNALNDEARQAREARDTFNAERRRIYDEAQALLGQRQALQDQIKAHKQARGEAQGRAKQLIAIKQEKRKGAAGGGGTRVRDLELQLKTLEFKQQTVPMSGPKEQELLDQIKAAVKELEEARKVKAQQDAVFGEIKDIDAAINEAFAKADAEHAKVVELSNAWQELTNKLEPAMQELGHLKEQADKKHHEFLELRKRADAEHAKASELKGEVDAKRAAVDALYDERRAAVQELRQQVKALEDPRALEASADEAVKALLAKGRISL